VNVAPLSVFLRIFAYLHTQHPYEKSALKRWRLRLNRALFTFYRTCSCSLDDGFTAIVSATLLLFLLEMRRVLELIVKYSNSPRSKIIYLFKAERQAYSELFTRWTQSSHEGPHPPWCLSMLLFMKFECWSIKYKIKNINEELQRSVFIFSSEFAYLIGFR